jgi:hypothetical protein
LTVAAASGKGNSKNIFYNLEEKVLKEELLHKCAQSSSLIDPLTFKVASIRRIRV